MPTFSTSIPVVPDTAPLVVTPTTRALDALFCCAMIAVLPVDVTAPDVTDTAPPAVDAKMPLPVVAVTGPTVFTVVEPLVPKFCASTPKRASIAPFAVISILPVLELRREATIPVLPAFTSPLATIVTLPAPDSDDTMMPLRPGASAITAPVVTSMLPPAAVSRT